MILINKTILVMLLSFLLTQLSYAEKKKTDGAKTLSGISIIGNKDAPKSL